MEKTKKILCISSSGGHWKQLRLLTKNFKQYDLVFVTTDKAYCKALENEHCEAIPDASRWNKLALIKVAFIILKKLLKLRPDVVISTGAAPGFLAIFIARQLGIKTIWIDSIANVDELSLSGKKARKYADLWLTQWEHLAQQPDGPHYYGSIL